ncbi:MAG: alpha/beta hydrolase [Candidatus Marinimicrobia bacterium]|nr:alpha/beta hydrolase [Candidatus Neomarinimicrobiota bacterium]
MDINLLNSFLFHPRSASQQKEVNDHLVEVDEGIKVGVRFHLKNTSAPSVLFFHGNGEISPEYDDIATVYNQKGFNFIIADFRGYGFSNGTPTAENTMKDSHIILDSVQKYLKEKNYSGSIILMGRSLGSVSVLELAKRYPNDFAGLIIESGFAEEKPLFDLIGMTAGQAGFKKEDGFQNDEKIKKYKGPLLVIHAEQDHIIPFSQGEELLSLCPSENKKLLPISNANHNNILGVNPQMYFEEISRFINGLKKG